jgi:hypothetical protein
MMVISGAKAQVFETILHGPKGPLFHRAVMEFKVVS